MTSAIDKSLGPFPGGNNPFTCGFMIDGAKCGNDAAYVLKTAHTIQLCCDQCQRLYRAEGKGRMTSPPIVEFSLLELIPAREELLRRLDIMKALVESRADEIDELKRRDIVGGVLWVWGRAVDWAVGVRARLWRRRMAMRPSDLSDLVKAARERMRR